MFIIGLTTTDNRDFYLNQDHWATNKSDATQYSDPNVAAEMAEHFLARHDSQLSDWFVLELA